MFARNGCWKVNTGGDSNPRDTADNRTLSTFTANSDKRDDNTNCFPFVISQDITAPSSPSLCYLKVSIQHSEPLSVVRYTR